MTWRNDQVRVLYSSHLRTVSYAVSHSRPSVSSAPVYSPNTTTNQESLRAKEATDGENR